MDKLVLFITTSLMAKIRLKNHSKVISKILKVLTYCFLLIHTVSYEELKNTYGHADNKKTPE